MAQESPGYKFDKKGVMWILVADAEFVGGNDHTYHVMDVVGDVSHSFPTKGEAERFMDSL